MKNTFNNNMNAVMHNVTKMSLHFLGWWKKADSDL